LSAQISKSRLLFVDNLRTFLIALVFLDHLAIVYGSPAGNFYNFQLGQVGMPLGLVYVTFQAIAQAFFMGLLFLLSAYFTVASYDHKGPKNFLKDRLIRLGIPLVVFALIVDPIVVYVLSISRGWFSGSFLSYLSYTFTHFSGAQFGPLWFVLALLIFDVAYVGWRTFAAKPISARPFPKNGIILAFALLLGAATFAVRLIWPIGWTFTLLNFELPYFPQYIALFIVGLIAYRSNWLMTIPKETGRFWRRAAIALGISLSAIFLVGGHSGGISTFLGGYSWQAAAFAFWEQLFAVAVCISLTVTFREKWNYQNRFLNALSNSSFTAYIIQAPVLVFLALALQSIPLPLFLQFLIVAPIGVLLCFGFAYLIKKVPMANKVL
jgi:glucan biosynthesis protein C